MSDVSNIQKYKGFFPKESVNQLFEELTNEKVSKIFIGKDYKEIVSLTKLPELDLSSDYHFVNVDPIIVPKIVEKAIEHHIDTSFIDFTSASIFTNIQNIFGFGFQLLNYVIPLFFLVTILSSFFLEELQWEVLLQ